MGKTNEKSLSEFSPAADLLTFRDKVYTSRTLIIPETGRTLAVARGAVEVPISDEPAVSYLTASEEFEPLG